LPPQSVYTAAPNPQLPAALRGRARLEGDYGKYSRDEELKFKDTLLNGTIPSTAANSSDSLLVIPEGNGPSARIGRKINIRSISMHGQLTLSASAAGGSDQVCMYELSYKKHLF